MEGRPTHCILQANPIGRGAQLQTLHVCSRVGKNQTFIGRSMYKRYFWQGDHHTYGHVQCVYTVLANPTHLKNERKLIYVLRPYAHTHTLCI